MITGKVVSVADGDTITVLDADKTQHKIRLNGIDAPEKAQPFGQLSKQSLSDLVFGKTVQIDANKVDRYGREVGKVLVDGVDTNLEQVRRGLAWHYKAYQREQQPEDRLTYAGSRERRRSGPPRPVARCFAGGAVSGGGIREGSPFATARVPVSRPRQQAWPNSCQRSVAVTIES